MYDKPFHLDIVAPNRVVYRGEATSLTAPGAIGMFQVLFNHAPLLAQLVAGPLRVRDTHGLESKYAVGGGFTEVRDNLVTVLADSIEPAAEIDVSRAKAARERAELRLKEHARDTDIPRAQAALARALNRLKVAQSF